MSIGTRFTTEGVVVIASHMSDGSTAAVVLPRSPFWLSALIPVLISLVIPATACADIYRWTDERGQVNISNVPPPEAGKAKDVELVLKEPKLTASEHALLARIQSLERQVQEQRYAPQSPLVPPPMPNGGYYPSSPPPPPDYYDSGYRGYVSGYDSGYYGSYYPSSYPIYYSPSYSYAVYRARAFVPRPVFAAPRGGSVRGGGGGGYGGGHVGGVVRGGGGHSGGGGGHSGSGHGGHG